MKICKVEKKREVVDVEYEVCGNEYCCERMRKWLRIDAYGRNNLKYNSSTGRFNICVREEESGSYGYRNGNEHAAYEDLDFCPFCGERLQETQPKVTAAKAKKKTKKFLRRKK